MLTINVNGTYTKRLRNVTYFVVPVQGCVHMCTHCPSDEYVIFSNGRNVTDEKLVKQLLASKSLHLVITGGEPLLQAEALKSFLKKALEAVPELKVFVCTGYSLNHIREYTYEHDKSRELFKYITYLFTPPAGQDVRTMQPAYHAESAKLQLSKVAVDEYNHVIFTESDSVVPYRFA